MALQESIKRTETNQQTATAMPYVWLGRPAGHAVTATEVTCHELCGNDHPVLPSTPSSSLTPLTPLPCPGLNLGPKAQRSARSKR